MKKICALLLFTLLVLNSQGQSIVNSTNLWSNIMALEPTLQLYTEKIKFTSDTVIGLTTYKIVERTLDKNQLIWHNYGFIREDANKRVYYKLNADAPEKLLYDLTLNLGDSVMAFGVNTFNFNAYLDSSMYHVTSIDSMLIGSLYKKKLHLSVNQGGTMVELEQWIDSMGSMRGMLHNLILKVGEDSYGLLCFEQNGILLYHNSFYTDCFVATGIELSDPEGVKISVFPNPASDRIFIHLKNYNSQGKIIISDGFGRICFSEDNFKMRMIDVSGFAEGIYLLKYSDGKTSTLKKFLVAR